MNNDEKIDSILAKLSEKKGKDSWEKLQIVATICTGLLALLLTGVNLSMTQDITKQSQKQSENFHREDSLRKEQDEYIQELNALPKLADMLTSPHQVIQTMGVDVLENIKNNGRFKNHPFSVVKFPKDQTPDIQQGQTFWVYLGQQTNGKLDPTNFGTYTLPSPNSIIKAVTDIYKRDSTPSYISQSKSWKLGNIIGVLNQGKSVTVIRISITEDSYYWALVRYS